MNKISIIIPVHEFNEVVSTNLVKALKSITDQTNITEEPNIIIVAATKIKDDVVGLVETLDISNDCQIIDNKGKTDYQSQVNLAVKSVKTEYFFNYGV